ncbi:MAG: small subunit ribosomal protein S6 [Verrucomicrobia bacterium]|jgi:small subunit ribosomal protein S6|nr:MAG: small subunit ribosomal protein S6 [Verrucomicrobiota bacterium]
MSEQKRDYEAIIVLNLQGEEGIDEKINAVGREIEEEGAKLEKIDRIGKREFAYNARKKKSGYYVNYFFKAEPDTIAKLRGRLRINPDIYLQSYQRIAN